MNALILETERLRLRPWHESDADFLYAMRSDPDHSHYIPGKKPLSQQEAKEQVQKIMQMQADGSLFGWVVCDRRTGDMLGTIGFKSVNLEMGTAEVGTEFLRAVRNNGYPTEALHAILEFAAKTIKLKNIQALVHPQNAAARAVLEKCGFTFLKEEETPGMGAHFASCAYYSMNL